MSRCIFVSCDVVFEEGQPRRTSASVGEEQIPLFDATTDIVPNPPADVGQVPAINNVPAINIPDHTSVDHANHNVISPLNHTDQFEHPSLHKLTSNLQSIGNMKLWEWTRDMTGQLTI